MEVKCSDIPSDDGDRDPQNVFCQTASEALQL